MKRRALKRGSGLLGVIFLAFIASTAVPPLAPIGMPIVVLGALAGTFLVVTLLLVPLGLVLY